MSLLFLQSAVLDTSTNLSYLGSLLVFVFVVLALYVMLKKTEIVSDSDWINSFVSLLIGGVMVSVGSVSGFLLSAVPIFAVFFVALFFVIVMTSFMGVNVIGKTFGIWVVSVFLVIFGILFFVNFSSLVYYLPGPFFGFRGDGDTLLFLSWIYSPEIFNTLIFISVTAVIFWVFVRKGK